MRSIDVKVNDHRLLLPEFEMRYATPGSAGIDLRACIDDHLTLEADGIALIPAGFSMHIVDPGLAAQILPRSGLGNNHGIVLGNLVGLMDSDYTGDVFVSLWNRSNTAYTITPMQRIAQMVFIKVEQVAFTTVVSLGDTSRGAGGFGHTGSL